MIDPTTDFYYNIIFTIFIGIVAAIILNYMFKTPTVVTLYSDRVQPSTNTTHWHAHNTQKMKW